MRLIFTCFLVCIIFFSPAQSVQQQKTDSIAHLVQGWYNKKDAASIYALAGKSFRDALSEQTFTETINNLAGQIGELSAIELETFNNNVARYKAFFKNTTLTLYVGLDAEQKLETFLLREYEPLTPKEYKPVASSNPLTSPVDKKVDSLLKEFIGKNNTVGLVLGIWENGKKQVYGYAEMKKGNKKLPDGNTLFEIGSITKTFTATLLAHFVQGGKIKLDDPINKYLPDSIPKMEFFGKPITIQSLSNHSSGLPRLPADLFLNADGDNPYKHYDNQKLFAFLKQFKPYREPGKQYEYSNLAVGLLGVILERVSGKSYEQLVKDIIWKPLKMDATRITLLKSDSARFATGYDGQLNPTHSWEFQSLLAAGGIRSTVNDMLLYAAAQLAGGTGTLQKAIRLTHQQTFASGQTVVALGWHIYSGGPNTYTYLGHSGQTGGYASTIILDESKKRAVVILTNSSVDPGNTAFALLQWLDKR